jgi:thiol-disulfide isomerase/thioredoxin
VRPSIVIAGVLLLAGCGAADVEGSSEYLELRDDRDSIATALDETRAELDDARAALDDQLAVVESAREDAESRLAADDTVAADLNDLLVFDVMNRVGLSPDDARCVAEQFVADHEVRRAYLLLIDPEQTETSKMETAYGQVTVVMEECGLEIGQPTETVPPAEAAAALAEVLGDVEVVGDPLPQFTDGAIDPAVGTAAPVVIGADYAGEPVTIDAASDGPTMVIVMAHWCPHCNAEIPKLNQLRDEGRVPDGVNVVAVSSGVNPDRGSFPPAEWLEDADWTFPVVADGLDDRGAFIASTAYGTAGVPFVILIDGDGDVAARWAGERSLEEIAAALTQLTDG